MAVLALTDSPEEKARLQGIGVAAELTGVDAAALAGRIAAAVARCWPDRARRPRQARHARHARRRRGPARPAAPDVHAAEGPEASGAGQIIAVWGPAGSPGRTMLAANMAAELAAEGKSVLLVDADSYGASVAAMLGLLDEAAGLAQACRLADQGLLDAEALLRIAAPVVTRTGTFRVLTGITRADRWTELRAAALSLVLARARQIVDVTVIDTGFCLESRRRAELRHDGAAPERRDAEEP